jgi:hypothetical protein
LLSNVDFVDLNSDGFADAKVHDAPRKRLSLFVGWMPLSGWRNFGLIFEPCLTHNLIHYRAVHVGQTVVSTLKAIRQSSVVDSHLMQKCGIQIVYVD